MTYAENVGPERREDEEVVRLLSDVGGRKLNRRQVLRRGIALGLSVPAIGWLLAACGSDDDAAEGEGDDNGDTGSGSTSPTTPADSSASGSEGSPASGGTAQNGGRLTLVITGNIPDLDPHSAYDSTASSVFFGTHEMLVRFKGSSTEEYEPMLAESWESNEDNTVWTFRIPDGVKFHDGTDCDANAVAESFKRFHQLGLGPVNVITRFVESPDDITAPDKNTLQFNLKYGTDFFISAMASQYGPLIVSPAAVEANATPDDPYAHEWMRENAVGTGPYRLVEYVQNDRIVLERFPEFHRGWEGNHFDEIVYRIVPESSVRRQIVEAGEGDALTQSLTPEDVVSIEEAGQLTVLRYESTNADWVAMNYEKLADVKLREALCWAFPYEDVRQGVMQGLYERSSGPVTPTTLGYPEEGFIFDTDLDQAQQLLDESGFDTSQTLVWMANQSSAINQQVAQLFQANLAEIGITMEIQQMEEGALTDLLYGEAPASERPEFVYWGWWPDYNDAWNEIYPNFHTESIAPNGSNATYYSNAEVDELLDSISEGTPGPEYNEAIAQINDILVRQDPAAIFVGALKWYTVMQPNIKGFTPNPIYINTYNVYDMYRE